jgi:hypothetical protein
MKSHIHISLAEPYPGVHDTVCDELNMAPSEANRFNPRGNMSAIFSCHI